MEKPRTPLENPRAVFLDADETTVYPSFSSTPTARVLEAISLSYKAGIPVTFITGRTYVGDLFEGAGIRVPIAADYGSTIIAPDGNVLWQKTLDPDNVKNVLQRLTDITPIKPEILYHSTNPTEQSSKSPHANVFRISVARIPWSEDAKEALEKLKNEFFGHYYINYPSGTTSLNFYTQPFVQKDEGLVALSGILGVPPQDIITAGDDFPDIDMFRASGWGAAVENAHEKVKEEADMVVPSVMEDGVAYLIEEYVLNRNS